MAKDVNAVWTLCALLLVHPQSCIVADEPAVTARINLADEIPDTAHTKIWKVFTETSPEYLRLRWDPDTTVALHAAWLLTLPVDRRSQQKIGDGRWGQQTEPVEDENEWMQRKWEASGYFRGFFEGRTQISPPKWWIEDLIEYSTEVEEFLDMYEPSDEQDEKISVIPRSTGFSIRRQDEGIEIQKDKVSVKVPIKLFSKILRGNDFGLFDHCSINQDSSCVYFLPFAANGNDNLALHAFSKSGELQWTAPVWGARDLLPFGPDREYFEIVVTADQICVFGVGALSVYAEAFEPKGGRCQFRFSSNLWDKSVGPDRNP